MSAYRKTTTAFTTGMLGWANVVVASAPTRVTAAEWVALAIAVALAAGVYQVANG